MYTAIAAVNIVRLTENPSRLPFALYGRGLHTHRAWWSAKCGQMVPPSTSLPPASLKLCLRAGARAQLATQTAFYLRDVFERIWI